MREWTKQFLPYADLVALRQGVKLTGRGIKKKKKVHGAFKHALYKIWKKRLHAKDFAMMASQPANCWTGLIT